MTTKHELFTQIARKHLMFETLERRNHDSLDFHEVGVVGVTQALDGKRVRFTTNLPFERWVEVLGSERLTGATLDRLTHRCHIIESNGESYRLKDARRRRGDKASDKSDKPKKKGASRSSGGVDSNPRPQYLYPGRYVFRPPNATFFNRRSQVDLFSEQ